MVVARFKNYIGLLFFVSVLILDLQADTSFAEKRRIINLDGLWEIAEGSMEEIPQAFSHRVQVPGLVDMAEPPFSDVGQKSDQRQAFWYRRTFKFDGEIPDTALLKIHKAKYCTGVYMNGQLVGNHLPCFTPAVFDVRNFLRSMGVSNEIIIRVGADRSMVPKHIADGFDFEKIRYIPGIYDSVHLILSGSPYILHVQAVPDLAQKAVKVVVDVDTKKGSEKVGLTGVVCEVSTGEAVGKKQKNFQITSSPQSLEMTIPIKNCQLWTPENPFLYELTISTGKDNLVTRFGMRSFAFDRNTRWAVLNGKPYFMRGTNICIYRFFEDQNRQDKPWRKQWVRKLLRRFKQMNWNSIRFCIGFPPEIWYELADEEGFLIQDEYPLWYLNKWPEELKSEQLIREFGDWMRERWNHPCVVIWDAQNETNSQGQAAKTIDAVRGLDLSHRPWDNGWESHQSSDSYEAHPYPMAMAGHTGEVKFRLADLGRIPGVPGVEGAYGWLLGSVRRNTDNNPVIINEYGWMWLNRDGSPTTLSRKVYKNLLGENPTISQLRQTYARYLAAMTEFWRCHRQCAAVLHFCGLGYSRPDGQTCDHFLDIETLEFEPNFKKYVADAFSPVSLMIDEWSEKFSPGQKRDIPVVIINDLNTDWNGTVRLRILKGNQVLYEQLQSCLVKGLGKDKLTFNANFPDKGGEYQIVAECFTGEEKSISSIRDFKILTEEEIRRDN